MNKNPNVKALIDSLFPDHVSSSYPRLVEFAKAFFDYLETQNKSGYYQNTLYYQRDIREQDPQFLDYIRRELGLYSARLTAADPKVFYDYLVDIWRSKGSEESIKTFFKLFLDDEITIIYPWESVLIPSDGRWIVDNIIRVVAVTGDPFDFTGKRIYQVGSSATAIVDSVKRKIYPGIIIYELKLIKSTVSDSFIENSIIYVDETLQAEVCRSVTGIEILNGGTGYSIGDRVYFNNRDDVTYTAFVSGVNSEGSITAVNITDYGYSNTPSTLINANEYYLKDFYIYLNDNPLNTIEDFLSDPIENEIVAIYQPEDDAVYLYDTNGKYIRKIPNPDAESTDNFGSSIAVSVALNRIVIGANSDNTGSLKSGSAYIFTIDGTLVQKITSDSLVSLSRFGAAVAIEETTQKILVGAYLDYNIPNTIRSGTVYVFDLDGALLSELNAPSMSANDNYGISVSAKNGMIVIGATGVDDQGNNSGGAYLYTAAGTFVAELLPNIFQSNMIFGFRVAIGNGNVYISAYGENNYTGAIYVFDFNGDLKSKILPEIESSNFGVDIEANNDRLIVSIYLPSTYEYSSSVYVYDNELNLVKEILNPNTFENFGNPLYITDNRLIVSTRNTSANDNNYIYDLNGNLVAKVFQQDVEYKLPTTSIEGTGSGGVLSTNFGTLITSAGRYEGVKGQLSESIVLQDSRYYQKYSYEVRTTSPIDNWIVPFKKMVHPSGTEIVPNVITFNKLNVGLVSITETVAASPPDVFEFTETITVTDDPLIFEQDYFEDFYAIRDYAGTTYA